MRPCAPNRCLLTGLGLTGLGLAGLGLALAAPLAAQRPITVLLRDPSGAAIPAATGWLQTEPRYELQALRGQVPAAVPTSLPQHRIWTARSNDRGVLRFGDDDDAPETAGNGYVTTEDGLGALLPRLHAGRADRVTLQPMAAVTAPGGSERFTLHAVALLPGDRRVALPPLRGAEVRLPAGTYDVWASSEEGFTWRRLHLVSGGRHELSFAGDAQRLRVPSAAIVHPASRADLTLEPVRGTLLLRGPALAAPLVTWLDGVVTPPRVVPGPPTPEPRDWPPPGDRRDDDEVFRLADAADGGRLFGLRRGDDGTFRVVAFADADGDAFRMPRRPGGDAWLLLLTNGGAPHAQPWSTTAPGTALAGQRGLPLAVTARAPSGLPAIDLAIVYVPDGQAAAAVAARTDASGRAEFGPVTVPGTLFVRDERFANRSVELDTVPKEPFALQVDEGGSCHGTAALHGGGAATTIVVTLRDPSGRLQPNERSVAVAAGERFSFRGLPDDRDLVLFATAWRDGRAWSVRQRVRSGDDVTLTLRDEDPLPLDRR